MLKALCLAAASLMSSAAFAQTASPAIVGLSPCENRIGLERENCLKDERTRTGPGPAQPIGPIERDAQRCDAMHGEAKERCLRELRAAMRAPQRDPHEGPGPEALGGTPAGSGATSGTAGGSSVGAAAPR